MNAVRFLYGHQRFDGRDPALMIAHGTEDLTVPYDEAQELASTYQSTGAPYVLHPIENRGHGPWNAIIGGKNLAQLSFEFMVAQQALVVD